MSPTPTDTSFSFPFLSVTDGIEHFSSLNSPSVRSRNSQVKIFTSFRVYSTSLIAHSSIFEDFPGFGLLFGSVFLARLMRGGEANAPYPQRCISIFRIIASFVPSGSVAMLPSDFRVQLRSGLSRTQFLSFPFLF